MTHQRVPCGVVAGTWHEGSVPARCGGWVGGGVAQVWFPGRPCQHPGWQWLLCNPPAVHLQRFCPVLVVPVPACAPFPE